MKSLTKITIIITEQWTYMETDWRYKVTLSLSFYRDARVWECTKHCYQERTWSHMSQYKLWYDHHSRDGESERAREIPCTRTHEWNYACKYDVVSLEGISIDLRHDATHTLTLTHKQTDNHSLKAIVDLNELFCCRVARAWILRAPLLQQTLTYFHYQTIIHSRYQICSKQWMVGESYCSPPDGILAN